MKGKKKKVNMHDDTVMSASTMSPQQALWIELDAPHETRQVAQQPDNNITKPANHSTEVVVVGVGGAGGGGDNEEKDYRRFYRQEEVN